MDVVPPTTPPVNTTQAEATMEPSQDLNSVTPQLTHELVGEKSVQSLNENVVPEPIVASEVPADLPVATKLAPIARPDPSELTSAADTSDQAWVDPLQASSSDLDSKPASSPFLTDTKVDKRPLGAYNEPAVPGSPEAAPGTKTPSTEQATEPSSPISLGGQVTTPELGTEVVSVEAGDIQEASDTSVSDPAATIATMSIPNQRPNAEIPISDSTENPVFDTKEYHAALPVIGQKKARFFYLFLLVF